MSGQMAAYILVTDWKIGWMAKESLCGQMAKSTLGNTQKTKNMEKEYSSGLKDAFCMGNGKMANREEGAP